MIPNWVAPYTQLRFHPETMNCWTLVRRVLAEEFKVSALPPAGVHDLSETEEIATQLASESIRWQRVGPLAKAGDVICFRMFMLPQHVGVVVDPPHFLHVWKDIDSVVERWSDTRWRNRVIGIYRHPELTAWT